MGLHRGGRRWILYASLVLVMFGMPSLVGGRPVSGVDIPQLVRAVLMAPLSESVPILLPVAKLVLAVVTVIGILGLRQANRWVLGYYAVILVAVAVFQNSADLPGRGWAVLLGNLFAQLTVAGFCVHGAWRASSMEASPLRTGRLWVLAPMLLAWWFPFGIDAAGNAVAGGWDRVLGNGAGVAYCMITPLIMGVMLLRPSSYPALTRSVTSFLGVVFGLLNVVMWTVLSPGSWWMAVLHVPLLLLSGMVLITSRTPDPESPPGRLPNR